MDDSAEGWREEEGDVYSLMVFNELHIVVQPCEEIQLHTSYRPLYPWRNRRTESGKSPRHDTWTVGLIRTDYSPIATTLHSSFEFLQKYR